MDLEFENDPLENQDDDDEIIDVQEENDNENEDDVFPFNEEKLLSKLREKPRFPPEPTECGTAWPKKSYKDFRLPVSERLTVHTLSSIDQLKKQYPFPKGCIPPLSLPSWHYMPLEKRIPLVQSPQDLFYYTRGKLAQKIHRKPVVFSLTDPYNRERVICEPYEPLHDPHIKQLLFSPLMRSLLYRRGFINEYNEVLCTLREFNKFRDYLRTQYCDQIRNDIESTNDFIQSEKEQLRMLLRYDSETTGSGKKGLATRIAAAKRFQMDAIEFRRQRQRQKDEMIEARLNQWRAEKERKTMEQILKGIEEARRKKERLQALYELQLQQRRDIMTKSTRKFLETQERQQNDKAMMQAAYNKFLLEWIQSKYVFCYEKLVQKRQIQEDLRESLKYKARKRQLRLESYREQMPNILEKKKVEAARILEIVRKFAMRWLEKIRARLNAPKDLKHESCWIGQTKGVLDDTVKYLYQESGYEKLDDFILNIMKLKKQIQHQIEMEEAEEAALAAASAVNEYEDEAEEEGEEEEE